MFTVTATPTAAVAISRSNRGPLWLIAGLELIQKQQFTAMTRQIRVCLFSLQGARRLLMPRAQTQSGTLEIF